MMKPSHQSVAAGIVPPPTVGARGEHGVLRDAGLGAFGVDQCAPTREPQPFDDRDLARLPRPA